MRPHSLEVTAFGAFAGTVRVDFDDLAQSGLFLLHGETGAGKSTLLDALGFALYGRVPGDRGTVRRLRSDHAGATERTSVRLEVTIAGRRLRITRTPEQTRPKVRGDGMTTEPAKVLLEERTEAGDWDAVSTRVGEADQEITDRLGMTADQFFQVILLPQGEFARFLRAPSDERVVLLERLFGTDRFRDVEQWLAERRRITTQAVELQREAIARRVELIAQIADVEPPGALPGAIWAGDLTETAMAAVDIAIRTVAERGVDLETARAAAEATRALAHRQGRRLEADRRRAELAAAEPQITAITAQLEAALAAAEVAPLLTALVTANRNLQAAHAANRTARARAVAAGADPADGPAELRSGAQECERRQGRLADLHAVVAEAGREEQAAAQARAAAADVTAKLIAAATAAPALTERRTKALAARDAARIASVELPAAQRISDGLAEAARTAAELAAESAVAENLRRRHLAAQERALALAEEHLRLRRDRIDAMAAELAAKLTDGDPCPVCGSLDHPDKPVMAPGRVTREQEEAAGLAAESARTAAEAVGAEVAAALAKVESARGRLGAMAGTPAEDLAARARRAAARRAELATLAGTATALDTELSAVDAAIAELTQLRTKADEARAAAERDAAAADGRAARHRATLTERLGDSPDLATAIAAAVEGAAARTAAAEAREALDRAEAGRAEALRAAIEAADAAGFPDLEAAGSAIRDAQWRIRSAETVRAHQAGVDGLAAVLADPDLDVPTMPPADLATAAAAVEQATGDHQDAVLALAGARGRVAQLGTLVPALTDDLAALPRVLAEADRIRTLAELVAGQGQNTRRMTLSAFVLAARLEEVAEVASERLLRMTQGRYCLVHTDTGRDGRRRAGLGLLARDAWTGVDRDTATLSGGETFLASLALALGLADVVCAEAGGARLESLFVDEGFGSLDSDTLDEVMDVLDGLREGGRIVGVVSHVGELRQRIPTQLHVHKHESGSTVSVVA
ncbi:MAG TPA: SMC family ATPase [Sporichthya sp.]|nr:SMC family ATPase [Sporichthya sp.]